MKISFSSIRIEYVDENFIYNFNNHVSIVEKTSRLLLHTVLIGAMVQNICQAKLMDICDSIQRHAIEYLS